MDDTNDQGTDGRDSAALHRLMRVLWFGIAVGLFALIGAQSTGMLAAVGIGVLIFVTSFACGCFLGFLFGLPRVASREEEAPAPDSASSVGTGSATPTLASGGTPTPTARSRVARAGLLQSNTNLERISDWLTTMLVGATLVELHNINDGLVMFRDFLRTTATVFRDEAGHASAGALPTVGPIVLIFGAVCGFLYMYLNTRLVLVRLFHAIESLLSGDTKLPPSQQRAIRALTGAGENVGTFITRQFSASKPLTVEDALSLMFDLLYKEDPDRVIDLGAQLSVTDAVQRPDYWFYLAAAFGQKLHGLERGTNEWQSARDNALDCARRALALNQLYRERLWMISDPNSSDNDLAPLRDDPEFLRIVGRADRTAPPRPSAPSGPPSS